MKFSKNKFVKLIVESYIRIIIEHVFNILLLIIFILIFKRHGNNTNAFGNIIYLMIYVYILKFVIINIKQFIYIKTLNTTDLKSVEKQIEMPIVYSRWNYVLLDTYLINIKRFQIIKYEDIALMYKKYRLTSGNSYYFAKYLYIFTKKGNKSKYLIKYPFFGPFEVKDISIIINKKNPHILKGKILKNKKIFETKYKVKISWIKWLL